jgi:hypothetical protein
MFFLFLLIFIKHKLLKKYLDAKRPYVEYNFFQQGSESEAKHPS